MPRKALSFRTPFSAIMFMYSKLGTKLLVFLHCLEIAGNFCDRLSAVITKQQKGSVNNQYGNDSWS